MVCSSIGVVWVPTMTARTYSSTARQLFATGLERQFVSRTASLVGS